MDKLSSYDFELPEHLIAQHPLENRNQSRLLLVDPLAQSVEHDWFIEFPQQLQPHDLLVLNNTRVIPARFYGHKSSGGKIECLLEKLMGPSRAHLHIRASKAPKAKDLLLFQHNLTAVVLGRHEDLFDVQFDAPLMPFLQRFGQIPLPPYITRPLNADDAERYQTVFSQVEGAVAAPTAGLHFDWPMLELIEQQGAQTATITLHVGAGTFQPVRVDDVSQHVMHAEFCEVSADVCAQIATCRQRGGRVIAVGTTVLRALESAAQEGVVKPFVGETRLFVRPGFSFQVVDALFTNFHLPQSTLLMLVSAFGGYSLMKRAYQEAIDEQYRFFSYGDACFISKRDPQKGCV